MALSQEILDRAAPSPLIRQCPLNRIGTIRARRGEPGAWECLDEAIAAADGTGEPQQIVPIRLARAEACWLEGRAADAIREAELADDSCETQDAWIHGAVAVWLRRTGSARTPRGELAEPYQHQVNGHWEKAASLWTDLGCRYEPRWPAWTHRRRARCGRRGPRSYGGGGSAGSAGLVRFGVWWRAG